VSQLLSFVISCFLHLQNKSLIFIICLSILVYLIMYTFFDPCLKFSFSFLNFTNIFGSYNRPFTFIQKCGDFHYFSNLSFVYFNNLHPETLFTLSLDVLLRTACMYNIMPII
jgi:hypothetical protein